MTKESTQHAAAIALDWWQRLTRKEGVHAWSATSGLGALAQNCNAA